MSDNINDGEGTYDVVLLVEAAMSAGDAMQVRSLHSDIEDPVDLPRAPPPRGRRRRGSRPRSARSVPET